MTTILVFQPHYDDAVWSIAEHMLTWTSRGDDVLLCTIYGWTGAPKEDLLAAEHANVMKWMGLGCNWAYPIKDDAHAVRGHGAAEVCQIMAREIARTRPNVVVVPAGIHHPDHLEVACAGRIIADTHPVWLYEELPYYVLYPGQSRPGPDWELQASDDHFVMKKAVCQLYASQWAPHLERTVYAPERLWAPT